MSEPTSQLPEPSFVLETTTTTQPSVLTQKDLSPQEVERICKAFIRLITSGEEQHGNSTENANLPTQTAANR